MSEKKLMGRLEMHADTRILLAYLRERFVKEKEEFVAYVDLTAAIGGRDVQKEARGLLGTARRHLWKEDGVVLRALSNEGLERESKMSEFRDRKTAQHGRLARRSSAQMASWLERTDVSNEDRKDGMVGLAVWSAISHFATPKARRAIEGKIDSAAPKELPTAETLRAQFEK